MADDVTALLDTLNIPQAHLLGHSMGGMIALKCAARRPDRIRKLILASTTAKPAERDCVLLRNWAASQHHGMPPRLGLKPLLLDFPERFFQHPADVQAALVSA
jgi:pimeloyl-ACP methyl ester carboxylesterase